MQLSGRAFASMLESLGSISITVIPVAWEVKQKNLEFKVILSNGKALSNSMRSALEKFPSLQNFGFLSLESSVSFSRVAGGWLRLWGRSLGCPEKSSSSSWTGKIPSASRCAALGQAGAPRIYCKGHPTPAEMNPSPDLYETPGDRLDALLKHSLQPQEDWKEESKDVWQRMERFFRDQCFQDKLFLGQEVRVLKVVKGGSSGKGTTLNHKSDLDMILFLSCFVSFQNQSLVRKYMIDFIEEKLDYCSRSLAYSITVIHHREGNRIPRSLTLQIQCRKSTDVFRMDVHPAFDALGSFSPDSKPEPEIYESLINAFGYPGEYSPSFTQLQRHFVKSRPFKLKNLLRLVKFWYLKYVKDKYRGQAVPSKYALELLTIYAWERGTDESENFNLDEGLVAVMKLIRDYKDICIYWTKYYDFQNETVRNFIKQKLKDCRPVILDPADPTNNLGRGRGWDLMAREAVYCLRQACCRTEDPGHSWHVQRARDVQVTVKQTGQKPLTLSVNPYSPIWKMKAEIKRTNRARSPQSQYRLSFQEPGGERQLLSSQQTLADYGIFSKVNVRVLETIPPEIQVFVKDANGHSTPYAIYPDDTIRDLKEKIEDAGGPLVEDQILKAQGRTLWNRRRLEDLDIEDCDTITLIKRS